MEREFFFFALLSVKINRMKKSYGTLLQDNTDSYAATAMQLSAKQREVGLVPPTSFDGRIVWCDYLSPIMAQNNCGACYAFATISSLMDLFRMYTRNKIRPTLSVLEAVSCSIPDLTSYDVSRIKREPQYLMQLAKHGKYTGCKKGTLYDIARLLFRRGAVEQSCVPDSFIEEYYNANGELPDCRRLSGSGNNPTQCSPLHDGVAKRFWTIADFYMVADAADKDRLLREIKRDLCSRGPTVAGFVLFPDFIDEYDGTTVYIPKPGQTPLGGHAVKLVGWGPGYWIAANSWGVEWGDKGYFRIAMGHPDLRLEQNHIKLIPGIPHIMDHFVMTDTNAISLVRPADKEIRTLLPINPYNLYSLGAIQAILDGSLEGDTNRLIFTDKSVDINPNTFRCLDPPRPCLWVLIALPLLVVLITLLVVIYRHRFWS